MEAVGHRVVGSDESRHTEVKQVYDRLFTGDTVAIWRALKGQLEKNQTKAMLNQIFQVQYCMAPAFFFVIKDAQGCGCIYCIGDI